MDVPDAGTQKSIPLHIRKNGNPLRFGISPVQSEAQDP